MKIKNSEVESTPAHDIEITVKGEAVAMLRLYWTVRSGTYGHQVCSQTWLPSSNSDRFSYSESKTGGCGYCKLSHSFGLFVGQLLDSKKYIAGGGDVSWHFRDKKYHKGGNFYSVPLSVLKNKFKVKK